LRVEVDDAIDPLDEVGRWGPAHDHPPLMGRELLPAAVQRDLPGVALVSHPLALVGRLGPPSSYHLALLQLARALPHKAFLLLRLRQHREGPLSLEVVLLAFLVVGVELLLGVIVAVAPQELLIEGAPLIVTFLLQLLRLVP